MLLAIYSFLLVPTAARPWMANGTAWLNVTSDPRAQSLCVNSTSGTNTTVFHAEALIVNLTNFYHVPAKRRLNVTYKNNVNRSVDTKITIGNQTTSTNLTFLSNNTTKPRLITRLGGLFQVRH